MYLKEKADTTPPPPPIKTNKPKNLNKTMRVYLYLFQWYWSLTVQQNRSVAASDNFSTCYIEKDESLRKKANFQVKHWHNRNFLTSFIPGRSDKKPWLSLRGLTVTNLRWSQCHWVFESVSLIIRSISFSVYSWYITAVNDAIWHMLHLIMICHWFRQYLIVRDIFLKVWADFMSLPGFVQGINFS